LEHFSVLAQAMSLGSGPSSYKVDNSISEIVMSHLWLGLANLPLNSLISS